ncbi:hypothetical protein HOD75_03295 [archaeon]|jgi:hypothetical protein|nr:hypothetical protein [archaeon]MBT4241899.1 hypothetical protein [archaeon]MBT4418446.1 hypothetical protein [archaeon]
MADEFEKRVEREVNRVLFERSIERGINRALGSDLTIEEIRAMPVDEFRGRVEMAYGEPSVVIAYSGPRLVSHEECNQAYEEAVSGLSVSQKVGGVVSRMYAGIKGLFGR